MTALLKTILCLLLATATCSAQFVEVSLHIAGTYLRPGEPGQRTNATLAYDVHCVFGTNVWMIEGDFATNARDTWWSTGSNIVHRVVYTQASPEPPQLRSLGLGIVSHNVGDTSVYISGPEGENPFGGAPVAQLTWLAFCSGVFLQAEGRELVPPFPTGVRSESRFDQTDVFPGSPGLPERIKILSVQRELLFKYEVNQSTNLSGWTVPLQFEATGFNQTHGDLTKPSYEIKVTVVSIHPATEPKVPAEVAEKLAPKAR